MCGKNGVPTRAAMSERFPPSNRPVAGPHFSKGARLSFFLRRGGSGFDDIMERQNSSSGSPFNPSHISTATIGPEKDTNPTFESKAKWIAVTSL